MKNLKFVLYKNEEGNDRVLFPDYDIDFRVEENEEGKKYFSVINLYTIKKGNKLSCLFTDRIADIIKTIRDGNADCMIRRNILFVESYTAVRFIDREYGEKIRQLSLNGFKDSQFVYKIRVKAPICEKLYIGDDNVIIPNILDAKEFNSEDEAEIYMKNLDKSIIVSGMEDFDEEDIDFTICQDLKRGN